jgi:hypothetical protein
VRSLKKNGRTPVFFSNARIGKNGRAGYRTPALFGSHKIMRRQAARNTWIKFRSRRGPFTIPYLRPRGLAGIGYGQYLYVTTVYQLLHSEMVSIFFFVGIPNHIFLADPSIFCSDSRLSAADLVSSTSSLSFFVKLRHCCPSDPLTARTPLGNDSTAGQNPEKTVATLFVGFLRQSRNRDRNAGNLRYLGTSESQGNVLYLYFTWLNHP